jgi:hypothetical protein
LIEYILGQVDLHGLELGILLDISDCDVGVGSPVQGHSRRRQSRRGHLGWTREIVLAEAAAALISHQRDVKGTGDAWGEHQGRLLATGASNGAEDGWQREDRGP